MVFSPHNPLGSAPYKRISKFKTNDGVIHETSAKATEHVENKIFEKFKAIAHQTMKDKPGKNPYALAGFIAEQIMENRKELLRLMADEIAFEKETEESIQEEIFNSV